MHAENPPLARSDDGRSFVVGDAPGSSLIAGSLVIVSGGGERQLALVEERSEIAARAAPRPAHRRARRWRARHRSQPPVREGTVEEVDAATIEVLHATTGALLEVGTNLTDPGGAAKLLPHRFNRHTFWCGQSGSGKTYALGVVLEQLVAHTALPVVIFDPNSDFVRLGELNPEASGPDRRGARATGHPCASPPRRRRRRLARPIPRHEPAVEGGGAATRPRRRPRRVQHAHPPAGRGGVSATSTSCCR